MFLKTFKFRIYPSKAQSAQIDKNIGCCRWVYNWGLQKKLESYNILGKGISCFDLMKQLTEKKKEKEYCWLNEACAQSLQAALRHLDNAFTSFFKKQSKFPKFKTKKKSKLSCHFPQSIFLGEDWVKLPKIGKIPCIFDRNAMGEIKTCVISKTKTNKYFISILIQTPEEPSKKEKIVESTTLGLDLGIKFLVTLSDGRKIENPKYFEKQEKKLKIFQKRCNKKQKGSKNREKAKLKLALCYEKIVNQKQDFLHKLTYQLTHENQVNSIGIENLNIKGMVKNHKLSKSINSCKWGELIRQLEYKCNWYGKNLIKIGRFEPSSKMCCLCGRLKINLTLEDREWMCEQCQATHDRDVNAAKNIKHMAYLTSLRTQGTESETKQSFPEQLVLEDQSYEGKNLEV